MKTTLSILGLYEYDQDVFLNLHLPTGMNKQQVIDTILMEAADLSLTYPDWNMMQYMIGTWSTNKQPAWERILAALTEEYDPLHNYDRHEIWTDNNVSLSGAEASGSNTESVAGFNSSNMANSRKTEQSTSSNAASNQTGNHTGRTYGNIGVTTSAQMLQGEIDVRVANDICNIIAQSFKNQFCIQVY